MAESVNDTVQEQVGEGNQYNESNQTQIGNLGTTYRTRFADVNQLDACRFQFDIPPGWKVESEQVGALMGFTTRIRWKIWCSDGTGEYHKSC